MEQQFLFPRAVDESTLFRILLCVCDIVTAKGQCLSIAGEGGGGVPSKSQTLRQIQGHETITATYMRLH